MLDLSDTWMYAIAHATPFHWLFACWGLSMFAEMAGGRMWGEMGGKWGFFLKNGGRVLRGVLLWFGVAFVHSVIGVVWWMITRDWWVLNSNLPTFLGLLLIWNYPGVIEAMGFMTMCRGPKRK